MPNPYHDAEGRFCSAGEMQKAIQTAAQQGDFETYYKLRTDYEAAQKDTVTVSKQLFAKSLNSAHVNNLKTVDEIKAVTETILQDETKEDYHKSKILIPVLENPLTPDEIKQQIFNKLDENIELKNQMFNEIIGTTSFSGQQSKILPQDVTKLVQNETNPVILKKALQLDHLTIEQKVEIADRYPAGMAHLAERHPEEIFSNRNPELKERFEQQAMLSLKRGDTKTKHSYFNIIGNHSSNPELIHHALTNYTPNFLYKDKDGFINYRHNPYGSYITNPHATPEDKLIALNKTGMLSTHTFKESLHHVLKENIEKRSMSPAEASWVNDGYIANYRKPKFNYTNNPTHTLEYEEGTKIENVLKENSGNMRIVGAERNMLVTAAVLKNISTTGYEKYEAQYKIITKENTRRRRKGEQQLTERELLFTERELSEIIDTLKQQSGIKEALKRYRNVIDKK